MSVADDVGGDDTLIVVAEVLLIGELSLEGIVDLLNGDLLVEKGGQLGDRAVRNGNTLCMAVELASDGWDNLADCLCCAGGVLDGVDSSSTVGAAILATGRRGSSGCRCKREWWSSGQRECRTSHREAEP